MRKDNQIEKGDIKAFLGPGSQFEGKLLFHEIVRLDGEFKGEIISNDTLIVGDGARVEAEISVGTLILSGSFKGNIKAAVKVDLRTPARVEGNIVTPALVVEEGVVLNSTLNMAASESVNSDEKAAS
ncbi:MAG TPA: polymer-forming cytoskeletal protein [Geothermobacteraceae bacterium]|nr:polymer-forming cytoskeletal protein [Geothermobacteraceae bacterium]